MLVHNLLTLFKTQQPTIGARACRVTSTSHLLEASDVPWISIAWIGFGQPIYGLITPQTNMRINELLV